MPPIEPRYKTIAGPGCYVLLKKNRVVYVGKTDGAISARVMAHAAEGTKDFDAFTYVQVPVAIHWRGPLLIESALIRRYMPKYNGGKRGSYRGSTGPLPGDSNVLFPSEDPNFCASMRVMLDWLDSLREPQRTAGKV